MIMNPFEINGKGQMYRACGVLVHNLGNQRIPTLIQRFLPANGNVPPHMRAEHFPRLDMVKSN